MLIYLPAGVRLLAVSIFGWVGIFGILLGWILYYLLLGEQTFLESVALGLFIGGDRLPFAVGLEMVLRN